MVFSTLGMGAERSERAVFGGFTQPVRRRGVGAKGGRGIAMLLVAGGMRGARTA
jgi:hypothetical protein